MTSFVFEHIDQQAVIGFQVGQYLSIELTPENSENIEIRQYSLSDKPNGKSYRISIKREQGEHRGLMSNHLHDHLAVGDLVDLHAPAGDFFLTDIKTAVVLVSAGVGITPMQAMLEKLAGDINPTNVYYLHACASEAQHSFAKRTQEICQAKGWHHSTWYAQGNSDREHIYQGNIDFQKIELPLATANFYLCGPVGFMQYSKKALMDLAVNEQRIHYEVFGPHANF